MSAGAWQRGIAIAVLMAAAACAWAKPPDEPPPPTAPAPEAAPAAEEPILTGEVTREQVEEFLPDWVQEEVAAQPDAAAVQALAAVPAGAEVTVYLGTWCSDSRRELARFWRVLDEAGGTLPFALRYVAVGRDKNEPAALTAGAGLLYVPTFVVERDGREVGRIVEAAPRGIEGDLAALLDGTASGVVSAREDLPPQP
ncbi:MAG TPA: hypothetical protein VF121_09315 [Thermoanaerobaculia bacterium]|nr:hypothetical protein [Thermoanaerobaculia bacterium]